MVPAPSWRKRGSSRGEFLDVDVGLSVNPCRRGLGIRFATLGPIRAGTLLTVTLPRSLTSG